MSVSERFSKRMPGKKECRTTEAGTAKARKKSRENGQCTIPGIHIFLIIQLLFVNVL